MPPSTTGTIASVRMDAAGGDVGGQAAGGGKSGGERLGRNGHRRDLRPHDHRSGFNAERGNQNDENDVVVEAGAYFGQPTKVANDPSPTTSTPSAISDLEKRLVSVQQDFTMALHKTSEKENEKFDLIFEILSQLQTRQAKLEESVRSMKAQYGCMGQQMGGNDTTQSTQMAQYGCMAQQMGGNDTTQSAQMVVPPSHQSMEVIGMESQASPTSYNAAQSQASPPSYSGAHSDSTSTSYAQKNGGGQMDHAPVNGMGGHLANGMSGNSMSSNSMGNQHMQQYSTGMLHHGGGQPMFAAMPQVVMVPSSTTGGMQYIPQMMFPNGSMQPVPHQIANLTSGSKPAAWSGATEAAHDATVAAPAATGNSEGQESAPCVGSGSGDDGSGGNLQVGDSESAADGNSGEAIAPGADRGEGAEAMGAEPQATAADSVAQVASAVTATPADAPETSGEPEAALVAATVEAVAATAA